MSSAFCTDTVRERRVVVRQDSKLFCKVIEAKGVSSVDQIFCTIHLDNDKYSQTRVIHGKRQERRMLRKSVWTDPCNPFWAEEFEYNTLPQHFQELKIIMWAFPHGAKAAVPVGRVRIPRQVLLNQTNNTESWHPMRSAAKEHPVPGRLRVQIDTKNSPAGPCVSITLVEGRDMIYSGSPKTCACIIELINSVSGEIIEHIGEITGQVVDDTVKFKDAASTHFTLKAKHEHLTIRFRLRMDQKDALGQKTLEVALLSTVATDVWYNLTSADDGDTNPTLDRETTVQLRLKVLYQENSILPLSDYQELWSQFSDFPVPVFQVLDKVCYSKEDMAISLLRLYASRGEALMFLKNVIELETTNTKTFGTLFRAQSITTKAIEYYFKTVGAEYLAKTLKPHIDAVIAAKKCTEVNPSFIQKGDGNVKKNLKALENNIKRFTDAILDSVDACPIEMRIVLSFLKDAVTRKFGYAHSYSAVSAFLFLRLFCPAIMGPKLFGLADQFPDEKVARSLTLIAKTLQSLASLVQFGEKEQYMRALNFYIVDNMKRMQAFLDSISVNTIPDDLEEMEMNLDPGRELSRLHRNLQLCNSECQDMLSKTEDMDADALNRVKAVCSAVDRMTALHIKYKLASQLRFRSQFAQLETTSENSEGEALVYSATMEPSIPVGEGDLSIAIAIAPDKVEKVDVNKEAVLRALSDFMTELVSNLSTLLACSSATQKTAYPSTVSDLVSLVDEFGTYLSPRISELHQDRITELVDLVQKAKAQALIFAKDPIAEPSAVIKIAFQCLQTTNSLVADLRKTFVMDEIENQKSKIQIQVSTANDDPPRKNPRLTRYHSNLLSGIALTEIRPEPVAPTGETVYMAACAVDRSLSVHPPHVVREAFTLYRTTLRVLLRVYNGYEVTEGNGLFLCAFGSAKNAIKWATDAQASLVSAAWPVEMTEAPKNVVYSSEDKTVLFRGVRAKAGVTAGKVDVVRDTVTDRMMYTGTVVDLVEWIRDYAHAGEVLMPKAVWDETKDDIECTNLSTQLLSRPIDEHEEDGTPLAAEVENLELMQVLPAVLQMRNAYWAGLNKRRSVESGIKSMQERGIAYCEVPAGDCVIVSTAIKNLDQLRESHPSATIKALYLYGEVLKRATAALHGRELSMADGYFKVAFQSAVDAAEFACRVQLKLLQCPWPFDMLDAHICRTILSKSGKVIHRGLRVKTGISCGAMSATYNELTTVDDLSGAAISEADTAMEMADGGQILLSEGVHQKLIENLPPLKDLDIELTELGTYDTPAVGQMELWEIRSTQLRERKFVLNSSPSQPPTPMADKRQLAAQGSVGDVATLLVLMKPYADTHDSKGLDLDTIPERRTHQPRVHLSEQSEPCELSALSIDQHAPPSTPCDSHTQTPVVLTPRCSTTAILGEAGDEDGEDGCTIETTRCSPSQASSAAGGASKSAGLRMSPRSVRSQAMAQSNKPSLSEREVSPSASPRRSSHTSTKQIPEKLVLTSRKSLMKDIEPLYSGTEATACSRKKRAPPPPLSQPTTPTRKHVSGKPTAAPCIVPRPDKVEKNMQTGTTSASPSPPPTSHGRTPTTRAVVSDPPTPKRPIRAAPVPPPKLRRKPSTPPISPKARPTASHTSTPATPLFDTPTTPQANTPTTPQATTPTTPQATTPTASQTNTHLPPLRSRLSVHPGGPAHNATLTQTPKIKTPIARAESIATRSRMASSRVCVQCDHPVSYGSGDWLQIGESAYHRDHFRCRECKSHLSDLPFIMGDDGHVYCVSDYAKKFGDVCKVCDTPILPSETTVKGGEFAYHVEHFVCFHCKLSLVNQSFIQKYDNIYCLADFYNIIADKCEKCNTPVQDSDFIDAMGSSWHVECFVCHRCKASPDCAEGMYEHDGAPYCHKCYKDIRTEVYEKTGVELP